MRRSFPRSSHSNLAGRTILRSPVDWTIFSGDRHDNFSRTGKNSPKTTLIEVLRILICINAEEDFLKIEIVISVDISKENKVHTGKSVEHLRPLAGFML